MGTDFCNKACAGPDDWTGTLTPRREKVVRVKSVESEYESKIMKTEDAIKSSTAAMDGVVGDAKEEKPLCDDFERATGGFYDDRFAQWTHKNVEKIINRLWNKLTNDKRNYIETVEEIANAIGFVFVLYKNICIRRTSRGKNLIIKRYKRRHVRLLNGFVN
eukprot:568650_1